MTSPNKPEIVSAYPLLGGWVFPADLGGWVPRPGWVGTPPPVDYRALMTHSYSNPIDTSMGKTTTNAGTAAAAAAAAAAPERDYHADGQGRSG